MEKLRSIQILRFVASAMVIADHAGAGVAGCAGVDIFFVLSGLVMVQASQGRTAGEFFRDRATRVLPTYYFCAAPWLIAVMAAGVLTRPMLITTLTLWPVPGVPSNSVLPVAWTLSYELLFYSAFGVTLAAPWLRRWLPAAYTVALGLALFTPLLVTKYLGNPMIAEFLLGLLVLRAPRAKPEIGLAAILAGLAAILASGIYLPADAGRSTFYGPWYALRPLVWGLPAAAIVWGALQIEPSIQGRGWRLPVFLGDASYSTYLTNLSVIMLIGVSRPWPVTALICLAVGAALYRYAERPMLRLMRRPRVVAVPEMA